MDLQTIKDQTAMKISNDERAALNPHSVMYLYTDTVYFAIEAADLLWRGAYCPHNDAELIHDLIIASQIVGVKYHANELVHYLFVPGDKRFTSKVRAKFLKNTCSILWAWIRSVLSKCWAKFNETKSSVFG